MERVKVSALVVIAIALAKVAFGPWISEARAAGETVTCEAFYADQMGDAKVEQSLEAARRHMDTVKTWLEAHPGEPVFRTTFVNQVRNRYVDIVCVR